MNPTLWSRRVAPVRHDDTLDQMRREMDRIFGTLSDWNGGETARWAVPADVRETDEALEFDIEIPGLRPEDIDLTVENNVMTVAGEKKFERNEDKDDYRLLERRYGRFERSFRVPGNVKADDVIAKYENGVLHIVLPKTEESKPRRIPVETGTGARNVTSGKRA